MNLISLAYQVQMDQNASFADRLSMGGSTMLFGMLIIFSVLILIWGVLELFHYVFTATQNKKNNTAPAPKPQVKKPIPVVAPPVAPAVQQNDDPAVIAAITAAIMMMSQESNTSFRVVSFRRINKNTPWNRES